MPRMSKNVKKLHEAAKDGNAEAQFDLANRYMFGEGIKMDTDMALMLYREAAGNGHVEAQFTLGSLYEDMPGLCFVSETEALEMFHKAADQGHIEAQFQLGRCYSQYFFSELNRDEAYKWFKIAAAQEHAEAQFELGKCYYEGGGVAQNKVEAANLYRKAAEQGIEEAQYKLGLCYFSGEGVSQNKAEAVKLFEKAAEGCHFEARCNLCCCYSKGEGTMIDLFRAKKWLCSAEENILMCLFGWPETFLNAVFVYGDCCDDKAEAVEWLLKAAKQGHLDAQKKLYHIYADGDGVEKSEEEARYWREKVWENVKNPQKIDPAGFVSPPGDWQNL